jgi:hypothetical protein
MDSLRRRCFDCKHYIDAAVADTLDGGVIVSKFDFYHRLFAVVVAAAAADRKSTANRNIDLTDSIRDVDKWARCVICRNHFAAVLVVVAVGVVADVEIYLALCAQLRKPTVPYS